MEVTGTFALKELSVSGHGHVEGVDHVKVERLGVLKDVPVVVI